MGRVNDVTDRDEVAAAIAASRLMQSGPVGFGNPPPRGRVPDPWSAGNGACGWRYDLVIADNSDQPDITGGTMEEIS